MVKKIGLSLLCSKQVTNLKQNKMKKNVNLSNKEQAILAILTAYSNLRVSDVEKLIALTNGISGVSFVAIKSYSSDKSDNSEVASQIVNIGASYANMLSKDSNIYGNFDLNTVNVDAFNYGNIDTKALSVDEFKQAVKDALPLALAELQAPKVSKDTSADIWLNKALVFNLNTLRLSIFGQSISKNVEVKGDYKKVASAPKTIAKKLIELQAKGKAQTLRRFALDNLLGGFTAKGETLELW